MMMTKCLFIRGRLDGADGLGQWDLRGDWGEFHVPRSDPTLIYSRNYSGFLCGVSRTIGGRPIGRTAHEDSGKAVILDLLGCFVGKEVKPRFLGTTDSKGGFILYTSRMSTLTFTKGQEVPDESFKPTLEGLITRLWRV